MTFLRPSNRFVQLNPQKLHVFLLKRVPRNPVASFVLFAIEFSSVSFEWALISTEILASSPELNNPTGPLRDEILS